MTDLTERIEKVTDKYQHIPDAIIVETKSAMDAYCQLMGTRYNPKGFYNYSFRGIPLILPWQVRI